jgi:hypothetical protein
MFKAKESTILCPAKTAAIPTRNQAREIPASGSVQSPATLTQFDPSKGLPAFCSTVRIRLNKLFQTCVQVAALFRFKGIH